MRTLLLIAAMFSSHFVLGVLTLRLRELSLPTISVHIPLLALFLGWIVIALMVTLLVFLLIPDRRLTVGAIVGSSICFLLPTYQEYLSLAAGMLLLSAEGFARFTLQRNLAALRRPVPRLAFPGPTKIIHLGFTLTIALTIGIAWQDRVQAESFSIPPEIIQQGSGLSQKILQNIIEQQNGSSSYSDQSFFLTVQQIEYFLIPYLPYLPLLVMLIVIITLQTITFFVDMTVIMLFHLLLPILTRFRFIQTVSAPGIITRYTL